MRYIDTHTHIYGEEFREDIYAVIARAREAGACRLLLPNVDEASIEPMFALCERYPDLCFPMMGLQPEELPADPEPLLRRMENILRTRSVVAVGEVGIDLYWDASRREEQIRVFRREVEWAVAYGLPLVIHCRAAHRELCDTLYIYKDKLTRGGIFHCFGGTAEEARELLAFPGFFLGIGGVLTFRKSTLPAVLAEAVPLERIVVETDAPYLTPVPHRGKRNEPAYIPFILQKLAEVYGISVEEVAEITTRNAEKIFFPAEK
ncbi:MAG: TatD family hydrolase [Alloprevotella sp.]|nr:TatD family hydrolase [Alloprevotella sp.]